MADDTNTAEREAFIKWMEEEEVSTSAAESIWSRDEMLARGFQAGRASLAASAGSEPVAAAAQSALETLERTHQSLARQIDLIAERAPGNFLDKRPVVSTLTMHQRRTEAAAIALRTALVTHPSPPYGMAGLPTRNELALQLLVAGGFVTDKKLAEALALVDAACPALAQPIPASEAKEL